MKNTARESSAWPTVRFMSGIALIRKRVPLGPYSGAMPRALRWSSVEGRFLMSEFHGGLLGGVFEIKFPREIRIPKSIFCSKRLHEWANGSKNGPEISHRRALRGPLYQHGRKVSPPDEAVQSFLGVTGVPLS